MILTANERELSRMAFRIGLAQRRGLSEAEAERLADRLLARDRDRDDRRMCVECSHLQARAQRDGTDGCFAAEQGWLGPVGRFFSPLRTVLQRCTQFDWAKP